MCSISSTDKNYNRECAKIIAPFWLDLTDGISNVNPVPKNRAKKSKDLHKITAKKKSYFFFLFFFFVIYNLYCCKIFIQTKKDNNNNDNNN